MPDFSWNFSVEAVVPNTSAANQSKNVPKEGADPTPNEQESPFPSGVMDAFGSLIPADNSLFDSSIERIVPEKRLDSVRSTSSLPPPKKRRSWILNE